MHFIIIYKFQGIANCPNALGYKLKIFCSVSVDAVSKKRNIYSVKLLKIRNFFRHACNSILQNNGKMIKIELKHGRECKRIYGEGLGGFSHMSCTR